MTDLRTTGWQRRSGGVITAAETRPTETAVSALPDNAIIVEGYRGIRIMVLGDSTDEFCGLEVWSYERTASHNEKSQTYIPRLFLEIAVLRVVAHPLEVEASRGFLLEVNLGDASEPVLPIGRVDQRPIATGNACMKVRLAGRAL